MWLENSIHGHWLIRQCTNSGCARRREQEVGQSDGIPSQQTEKGQHQSTIRPLIGDRSEELYSEYIYCNIYIYIYIYPSGLRPVGGAEATC